MDYQLKPIGKTCAQTGAKLVPGDVCYSTVIPKGNDWERLDYSRDAWKGPPDGALGFWRTTVPFPLDNKRRTLDPNALLRHFEQLSEDANPAQEKFRYVLALLLVQRRRLRVTGSRGEGANSYLQLAGSEGEGPFEVREHELQPDEIETLEGELNDRMTADPESR